MADSQETEHGNTKPKCHVLPKNTKPQRSDEDYMVVKKQDGNTRTADEDIFPPEKILDSKTLISEEDDVVLKRTNSKEMNSSVASENSKENGKMNVLNDKCITDPIKSHNQSKSLLSKKCDGRITTFITQRILKPDSRADVNTETSQKKLINVQLIGNCTELQECHSDNLCVQTSNIGYKFCSNSGQSSASNMNSFPKGNTLDRASDSLEFKEIISLSIDNIAIPGPSSSREFISQSNISEQNIKNRSPLIGHTAEESIDSSSRLACKKKKNVEPTEASKSRERLRCFLCEYSTTYMKNLIAHLFSHGIDVKCDVCGNTFQSLSEFEDHSLTHEEHHSTFCRLCQKEINEHRVEGDCKAKLKCCNEECGFETDKTSGFKKHLYSHSFLEMFKCEKCGKKCRTPDLLWAHSQTHLKRLNPFR